jgi:hypothetical protein
MYGKPCRRSLSYGNLDLGVFPLCRSGTCVPRPGRIDRPRISSATRCWRQASTTRHLFEDHASGAKDDRPRLIKALDPGKISTLLRGIASHAPGECSVIASVQTAMATIITFSVNDRKPSGTLLPPPTQAHLSSRLSM